MIQREEEIRARIISENRPWGNYKRYTHNEQSTVKIITVFPNQMLSMQSHKQRDELWIILDDGLKIELGDKVVFPKPGDEIIIMRHTKHRLSSLGSKCRVLEVAFGNADENDIIRFEDIYGRENVPRD
jgi:mannose-6-phosphate isomerase